MQSERSAFAASLEKDRAERFAGIKIDGILEASLSVVVTYDPARGAPGVLGRHAIADAGLYSVCLAIENMWLACTAEGWGMGWVSFYREVFLRELLGIPDAIRPVAWLCIGPVTRLQDTPDLERHGWRSRTPLGDALHLDRWDGRHADALAVAAAASRAAGETPSSAPSSGTTPETPFTLAIDIGGTGLKASVLDATGAMVADRVAVKTTYPCPPATMVDDLVALVAPLPPAERVSAGFPGMVRAGRVLSAPHFVTKSGPGTAVDPELVKQWSGFDLAGALATRLGKPTRVANDADVQGAAVVKGKGLELVITLGTGVGTAFFYDGHLLPHLEFAQHPFVKGDTYNDQLGDAARKDVGNTRWNKRVRKARGHVAGPVVLRPLLHGRWQRPAGSTAPSATTSPSWTTPPASWAGSGCGTNHTWACSEAIAVTTDHNERPGHEELEAAARHSRRLAGKGLAYLVLTALVVVFVIQNLQSVRVHFLFFSGRVGLIWVILACLVAGAVLGSILRGRATRARRLRREERDIRRHGDGDLGF